MKNRVDPNRIVWAIEENFKDELSKPKLRNLILTSIAIQKVYKRKTYKIMVLVDEVDLIDDYKALVAAIPFRKRAIPIVFKIFTNQQIRDLVYRSKNWVIWNFMDQASELIQKALGDMDSDREPVFIFDRGFADVKLMKYLDYMGAKFIIRVRKNTGIVVGVYAGKLTELGQWGYFRNVV